MEGARVRGFCGIAAPTKVPTENLAVVGPSSPLYTHTWSLTALIYLVASLLA